MTEKKKRAKSIPWLSIKTDYVQGVVRDGHRIWPSLEDLAETYVVSVQAVRNRSTKESWVKERDIYKVKYEQNVNQKVLAQNVDREVKIRDRHIQVSELIIAHCFRLLAIKGTDGSTMLKEDVEAADVDRVGSALQKAQAAAFKALGIKDDPTVLAPVTVNVLNQEQRIQIQRLQVPFLKALCGEATEEDLKQIQEIIPSA